MSAGKGFPPGCDLRRPHEVALDRDAVEGRVGDLLGDDRLRRRGDRRRAGGRRVVLVLLGHLRGVRGVLRRRCGWRSRRGLGAGERSGERQDGGGEGRGESGVRAHRNSPLEGKARAYRKP